MVWNSWSFDDLETQSISELITEVFVEQPRLHLVCYISFSEILNPVYPNISIQYIKKI